MSKEYNLPKEVRERAMREARESGINPDSTHHILAKSVARKYHINPQIIKSDANAISLEQEDHDYIHQTYEEEDFIFVAKIFLGLTDADFEKHRAAQVVKKKGRSW